MTKIEFIRGEMMAAMKARDKKRKDMDEIVEYFGS